MNSTAPTRSPAPTSGTAFRIFSELDQVRITRLAKRQTESGSSLPRALEAIDEGDCVSPRDIPTDVITVNSRFTLQDQAGDTMVLTLCYPEQADFGQGCISVMSPIGGELLGRRVGDTVQWPARDGVNTAHRIESLIFQPEANGDYML